MNLTSTSPPSPCSLSSFTAFCLIPPKSTMSACPFAHLISRSSSSLKCPVVGAHGLRATTPADNLSEDKSAPSPVAREAEEKEGLCCDVAQSNGTFGDMAPPQGGARGGPGTESAHQVPVEDSVLGKDAVQSGGKCPLGFDSGTFQIGPLSCVLCKALLYDASRTVPCQHIFCRGCVARFADCPLCGADVEGISPDLHLQSLVDRYIKGHARIHRGGGAKGPTSAGESRPLDADLAALDTRIYEDASLERGSFLLQQAMRAFKGGNLENAGARLETCLQDLQAEVARGSSAASPPGRLRAAACQLGAVLGLLGDTCRLKGDADAAVKYYEESVGELSAVQERDAEVVHALSVSLNKLGDVRFYEGDLAGARVYYLRALQERQALAGSEPGAVTPSQVLDVAVSLSKVADVDRALGHEADALAGFRRALEVAEELCLPQDAPRADIEKRRVTLEFIHAQLPAA